MGRIFEVIKTRRVLGAQKNALNEGHVFAVQGVFADGF